MISQSEINSVFPKQQSLTSINGTKGSAGSSGKSDDATKASLEYDDFLELLVTQLKYQDPLNPMENHEMLAQNAQFTTVEQLIAIKDLMISQQSVMQDSNATYATSMIGREVLADVSEEVDGETVETLVSGVVKEVIFMKDDGEILLTIEKDGEEMGILLSQVVSVREDSSAVK